MLNFLKLLRTKPNVGARHASPSSGASPKAYDPAFTSWHLGNIPNAGLYRLGRLSFKELEDIYFQSSIIRAIIDGITRVTSSLDWKIVSVSDEHEVDSTIINDAKDFFMNLNANSESFSTLVRKLIRDLLIYDAAVIEKVMTQDGKLIEIYARDGSTFEVKIDSHGLVNAYIQRVYSPSEKSVTFAPEEIIYMSLYPRTSSPYGAPPLDALVNEISAAMFASRLIARSFEYDEVPPGILNLGKIGQVAYDRAREYFKEKRDGGRRNFELTIVHDTDKVEWIPLTRPPQELQLSELIDKVNRMIFRCFGVTPTEMGALEDINRVTAQVQESISRSKLIVPIVRMLEEYINSEIIWLHLSPEVKLTFTKPQEEDIRVTLDICDKLVSKGVLTINEARKRLGEKAIAGGDIPIIHTGGSIIPLSLVGTQLAVSTGDQPVAPTHKSTAGFTPLLQDKLYNENPRSQNTFKNAGRITVPVVHALANGDSHSSVGQTSRLSSTLLSEYENIHDKTGKWLIKELTKAYFKGDRTDDIIDRACAQLFGRIRHATQQHLNVTHKSDDSTIVGADPRVCPEQGNALLNTENLLRDNYLSPVESSLKTALTKFAKGKSGTQAGLMKALEDAYKKCKAKLGDCI